jgi:hypothetical protein
MYVRTPRHPFFSRAVKLRKRAVIQTRRDVIIPRSSLMSTSSGDDGLRLPKSSFAEKSAEKTAEKIALQQELLVTIERNARHPFCLYLALST